jgi:branched-chain amino acid transport system ATP-binding protein
VTAVSSPAAGGAAAGGAGETLTVDGLVVRYGGVSAVRGVDLNVQPGEMVALLGPNGAGKSSLLRCVSGAVPASGGRVRIGVRDITNRRPDQILRFGLAHVLEGRQIFGAMTVEENLRLGATIRRDPGGVEEDLQQLYERFPALSAKLHQRAMFLSGGQQQMVAIARAVLSRPRILLLDEPSLGLAPVMLEAVTEIISWSHQHFHTGLLIVEQHTALALDIASRCYVMVRGTIVAERPSAELADGSVLHKAYLGAALGG